MITRIDAETLREWLDTDHPVTVVDVRADANRAQWAIPGSIHINAYEALRAGEPGGLLDAALPVDRPIVTVCNAGRVSQTAAAVLSERGFDARSLAGGMKAWSLAWNAAPVPLDYPLARVVQVRRTGKGCLSYIVGSAGDAAVIDPSLPSDVYIAIARTRVTSQLPPTPPNFVRIVELNEAGELPPGDHTELEAGANRCAVR